MKVTVQLPFMNTGCSNTFSKKPILVLTPRIRNSCKPRKLRRIAPSNVRPHAVTFTNIESKNGEILAPGYAAPASKRMPKPPVER